MVKDLIKQLFVTNKAEYTNFPLPNELLPAPWDDRYHDYYKVGSGSIFLIVVLGIIVYHCLFDKGVEKVIARMLLLFLLSVQIVSSTYIINTEVFFTGFGVPVLNVPVWLFYLICFPFVSLFFISFRNQLHRLVTKKIIWLFDFCSFILVFCALLPLLTGELWSG